MRRRKPDSYLVTIDTDDGDRDAHVTAWVLHERQGRHHPEVFDVDIVSAVWANAQEDDATNAAHNDDDHVKEQIRDRWED